MSKFSRQLHPSDIPDSIQGELTFSALEKWAYSSDDNYSMIDVADGVEKYQLHSPEQFAEKYDLELDTATKLSMYQHAVLNDLKYKIEGLVGGSERYEQVKPYLDDTQYNPSLLHEYVVLWSRSDQFTKDNFNPITNLRRAFLAGVVSYILLGLFIASTLAFLDGRSIYANLPAALIALTWLIFTTYILMQKVRRNYRTRKLILDIYRKRSR